MKHPSIGKSKNILSLKIFGKKKKIAMYYKLLDLKLEKGI